MPSIEGGGVEKNFFVISNYLASKIDKVILITAEKKILKDYVLLERSNYQIF